jgi:hypothetical protein
MSLTIRATITAAAVTFGLLLISALQPTMRSGPSPVERAKTDSGWHPVSIHIQAA